MESNSHQTSMIVERTLTSLQLEKYRELFSRIQKTIVFSNVHLCDNDNGKFMAILSCLAMATLDQSDKKFSLT